MRIVRTLPLAAALILSAAQSAQAQTAPPAPTGMTFFITSVNPGRGGDLGGLAGADAHCQALATAAGAGSRTWRAYLSTQGANAVNARDRIGQGPWQNARGVVIAQSLAQLHGENAISKETALNERGGTVNGRGDTPNTHDIMTGSQADGTAFTTAEDRSCRNWTSGDEGSAIVGHHDRMGTPGPAPTSWNSSHDTPGCSPPALARVGGGGLFYCFATN